MRVLRGSRLLAVAVSAAVLAPAGVAAAGSAASASSASSARCTQRTLVLSAMPVELGPLLAHTTVSRRVTVDGRHFYVGTLHGRDVVLALTGIGPVNAAAVTRLAAAHFRCGGRPALDAIVFSGVSGGDFIGDVLVPRRWTLDGGKHFVGVDAGMLATARRLARTRLPLEQKAPAGDPACGCVTSPDAVTTVAVTHRPRLEVGGRGETTDPFSGRALPCAPGGGDVFGCEPCAVQVQSGDVSRFGPGVTPFVDPAFFAGYSSATGSGYVAEDEETAAVATVAAARHVPFLGFRAVSDGGGDPLGLPGFPVQFFYYRQLAADNAAAATTAFLDHWR